MNRTNNSVKSFKSLSEWTYLQDDMGMVYGVGRKVADSKYEVVAVYQRSTDNTGYKTLLNTDISYERLMYHGIVEEKPRLSKLTAGMRSRLQSRLSKFDNCLYIDVRDENVTVLPKMTIDKWQADNTTTADSLRESLQIALHIVERFGISRDKIRLYGGPSIGLVHTSPKLVDDIDFLLDISSSELLELVRANKSSYTRAEIDPQQILSPHRRTLKAKRWSTSQIRLSKPYDLSIDLKIARKPGDVSLWDGFAAENMTRCEMELEVIDDSEMFGISPAMRCVDKKGNIVTVLMNGYSYIGCAVVGDKVKIIGQLQESTSIILITQRSEDQVIVDMGSVPFSD